MSAPTTTPASLPIETQQQKAARYVPGAGDLASKRPKKKKAGLAGADSGKANITSISTLNGETNVALLSKAPNSTDLPAELRGEQGDIERELKQDAADAAAAGRHEKGAVGEAVSRRMKVLTKKIVSDRTPPILSPTTRKLHLLSSPAYSNDSERTWKSPSTPSTRTRKRRSRPFPHSRAAYASWRISQRPSRRSSMSTGRRHGMSWRLQRWKLWKSTRSGFFKSLCEELDPDSQYCTSARNSAPFVNFDLGPFSAPPCPDIDLDLVHVC